MAQLLQFFWIFLEFVSHFANGLREVPGRGLWRRGNQRFSGEKAMRQRKTPVWEANEHQLTLGGRIVKHFRSAAPCQEAILAAFQLAGWPASIPSDRLAQCKLDGKKRLRQAVDNLRRSCAGRLTFHLEGNSRGIRWDLILSPRAKQQST